MHRLRPHLFIAAMASAIGLVLLPAPDVRADVTISGTTVDGPQVGDGGAFSVTTTGTISSLFGEGIVATGTTAITTLTIDGEVGAYSNAVNNTVGSSITGIGVSGTMSGGFVGLLNSGTVGSLTAGVGGLIVGSGGTGISNAGTFTGTITNAGTIGGYNAGLGNLASGQIVAFTNSGLVNGDAAVLTSGTITTLTNQAGGHLQGGGYGLAIDTSGRVGTFLNSGSATGYNALASRGAIDTLTNSGTLAGSYQGIGLDTTATLGSFSNSGLVSGGGDWGMGVSGGATIGTLTNSGTFIGYNGIVSGATTGTIRNLAGGLIEGPGNRGLGQYGTLTLLENAGTITGNNAINAEADIGTIDNQVGGSIVGFERGLYLTGVSNTVTTLTNSGTIAGLNGVENYGSITTLTNAGRITGSGAWGLYHNLGNLGTLTNTASGTISGGQHGIGIEFATTGTIDNAGLIRGETGYGLFMNTSALTTLTNSGTITAGPGWYGVRMVGSSSVTMVGNSGRIDGERAFQAELAATIGTLENSGTMQGTDYAVVLLGATGTLSNLVGGSIVADGNAVLLWNDVTSVVNDGFIHGDAGFGLGNLGVLATLTNSGTIRGGSGGIGIVPDGIVRTISNSGTIAYSGIGTGAAIYVSSGGVLGDPSGTRGPAIVSTGSGALLDGILVHSGTIHHGFRIDNQSLIVSANGDVGTFAGGTLAVGDGDLTFTDGTIRLGANVAVNGGSGLLSNEATLAVLGLRDVQGGFTQFSVASLSSIITGTGANDYGRLAIGGSAAFAGTLDLALDGLSLADGQRFDLLTFVSGSGGFTSLSVDGVALASAGAGEWTYGSLVLREDWTPTSMSVSVVPEPSTLVLGTAGIAVAAWLRCRGRRRPV